MIKAGPCYKQMTFENLSSITCQDISLVFILRVYMHELIITWWSKYNLKLVYYSNIQVIGNHFRHLYMCAKNVWNTLSHTSYICCNIKYIYWEISSFTHMHGKVWECWFVIPEIQQRKYDFTDFVSRYTCMSRHDTTG